MNEPNPVVSVQSSPRQAEGRLHRSDGKPSVPRPDRRDAAVVEKAVAECFPKGTAGQDEHDILRTVFRHLKRAGTV